MSSAPWSARKARSVSADTCLTLPSGRRSSQVISPFAITFRKSSNALRLRWSASFGPVTNSSISSSLRIFPPIDRAYEDCTPDKQDHDANDHRFDDYGQNSANRSNQDGNATNNIKHTATVASALCCHHHSVEHGLRNDMFNGRSSRLLQERDEAVANFDKLGWAKGQLLLHLGSMRRGNRLRFQTRSAAPKLQWAFPSGAQKHPERK
jgi:hypothetical protein